jgi:hypothetical protein
MKSFIENKNDNLPMIKVAFLIFVPTTLLTVSYVLLGLALNKIPSLLLFFALATIILFPLELAVVFCSS